MPSDRELTSFVAERAGSTGTRLPVWGALPPGLVGTYAQLSGDSRGLTARTLSFHEVQIRIGPAWNLRAAPEKRPNDPGWYGHRERILEFGDALLVVGGENVARELCMPAGRTRPVDLAGARRALVDATVDPRRGDLHVLTAADQGPQYYAVVPPRALTRRIRAIEDAPAPLRQLEPIEGGAVFVADGHLGVAGEPGSRTRRLRWYEVDTTGFRIVGASARGAIVTVDGIGPSLVRWTLDRRSGVVSSDTLDAAPHRSATLNRAMAGSGPRFLWAADARQVHRLDLHTRGRRRHQLAEDLTPSLVTFVADPDRGHAEDGGWLLTVVHHRASGHAALVVLDAEALERPAVAAVGLPREMVGAAHATWLATQVTQI